MYPCLLKLCEFILKFETAPKVCSGWGTGTLSVAEKEQNEKVWVGGILVRLKRRFRESQRAGWSEGSTGIAYSSKQPEATLNKAQNKQKTPARKF